MARYVIKENLNNIIILNEAIFVCDWKKSKEVKREKNVFFKVKERERQIGSF